MQFNFSLSLQTKTHMWPDLRKGVFHTHAILETWKTVTWLSNNKWSWNFFQPFSYVGTFCWPNFKSVACANLKLWIVKVGKLDVCGRPLFANPVTYWLAVTKITKLYCLEYSSYKSYCGMTTYHQVLIWVHICKRHTEVGYSPPIIATTRFFKTIGKPVSLQCMSVFSVTCMSLFVNKF